MAKYFIIAGVIITFVGIILYFCRGALRWFGRLPGDIRIERENVKIYFPIVTMIVISLLLTLLVNILRRW
jgi:H+/Cl- antiporter ClcA